MRQVKFDACTVHVYVDRIITYFHDDFSISGFIPPDTEEFRAAARYAGYGDDFVKHGLEHDLTHAWLAQRMGWPHSWSVWSAAHGTGPSGKPMSQRVADEEHLCVRLQRFINTGAHDEYGNLEAAFPDLPGAARDLLRVLRPWLWGDG